MHAPTTMLTEGQARLSGVYKDFFEHVAGEGRSLSPVQLLDEDLPPLVRHYEYGLNSWPVFISPVQRDRLAECAISVPLLLPRLFQAAFDSKPEAVAAFYGVSVEFADFVIGALPKLEIDSHLVTRSDVVMTSTGLKILEINFGTNIGGWQIQFMDAQYRKHPPLKSFLQSLPRCHSRNIIRSYYDHLVQACKTLRDQSDGDLTWLFLADDVFFQLGGDRTFVEMFARFAEEDGVSLRVIFRNSMEGTTVENSRLFYQGRRIDALLDGKLNPTMREPIVDVLISGNLVWPDNPIIDVLSDKRNLALLYLHRTSPVFSDAERAVIEEYIPWSAAAIPGEVSYRGRRHDLKQLLLENREGFVIKRALGFRGVGVYVGKFLTEEQWRDAVTLGFESGRFLVQEFCASLPFCAQGSAVGHCVVDFIWGIFAFGKKYGGVWVRMMPKDGSPDGVINSARGAQEAIVYEVDC